MSGVEKGVTTMLVNIRAGLVSEKELSNVESKLYLKPPWNGLRTKGPHFVLKTREYTKG